MNPPPSDTISPHSEFIGNFRFRPLSCAWCALPIPDDTTNVLSEQAPTGQRSSKISFSPSDEPRLAPDSRFPEPSPRLSTGFRFRNRNRGATKSAPAACRFADIPGQRTPLQVSLCQQRLPVPGVLGESPAKGVHLPFRRILRTRRALNLETAQAHLRLVFFPCRPFAAHEVSRIRSQWPSRLAVLGGTWRQPETSHRRPLALLVDCEGTPGKHKKKRAPPSSRAPAFCLLKRA